jgi:hypothetical protein
MRVARTGRPRDPRRPGAASLLGGELEATAALVFSQALPGGAVPGLADSMSYAQRAGQWPDAGSDAYA